MTEGADYNVLHVVESRLGLVGTVRGNEFVCSCPNPAHPDHRPSFAINLTTGLNLCRSGCGWKGNLPGLIARLEGCDYSEALQSLHSPSRDSTLAVLRKRLREPSGGLWGQMGAPLPGPYLPEPLGYMRSRGFSDEILRSWGVRFCLEETLHTPDRVMRVQGCVAIPVFDHTKVHRGWIYRATSLSPEWQPRYVYTPGLKVSDIWFGEDRVTEDHVVVTEGALDAMWCEQAGYPAVAALGVNVSPAKLRFLSRFSTITVFADRDPAGLRLLTNIARWAQHRIPILVVRYPKGDGATDPCELSLGKVRRAVARAVPWFAWRMREEVSMGA